jgi:peptidoglycan hydrolase-like protein with peptidoglycan-binding domain
MKLLRFLGITLVCMLVLGATAYAAGVATSHHTSTPSAQHAVPEEQPATSDPTTTPSTDPTSDPSDPTSEPDPQPVLEPGDKGDQVREVQSRLFQLDWVPELTTGTYDAATTEAVKGFQAKRGFTVTGVVDDQTWRRLLRMTEQPTHDAMFNVLHAGPTLLEAGDDGDQVRDLQARLKQIQWYFGDVTGTYDATTVEAVKGFQAKREIPVTGAVDQRTLDRLDAMTLTPTHEELFNILPQPGALDPRCLTGRVLCIDKTSRFLSWVIDGQVQKTLEVRFGATDTPTREGLFHVYLKDADHVSKLFGSEMPFSMFFSGGQAVHYSSDFAARGYDGASHGCVNVRDHDGLAWLFDQVQVGDKVVVYWS